MEHGELTQIHPQLTVDDVSGAVFTPDDGYLNPYLLTSELAKQARDAGVTLQVDTEVMGVTVPGAP